MTVWEFYRYDTLLNSNTWRNLENDSFLDIFWDSLTPKFYKSGRNDLKFSESLLFNKF